MDNRNYREFVEKDTIEQFRGKPNIQVLHDALRSEEHTSELQSQR